MAAGPREPNHILDRNYFINLPPARQLHSFHTQTQYFSGVCSGLFLRRNVRDPAPDCLFGDPGRNLLVVVLEG